MAVDKEIDTSGMPPPPVPPPHLSTHSKKKNPFDFSEKKMELPELTPPEDIEEFMPEKDAPLQRMATREEKHLEAEKLLEETFDKSLTVEDLQQSAQAEPELEGAKALFDSHDIELKTDLSPREVVAASKLLFIANRYDIHGLNDFINDLLKLKVSQFRRGRGEFIQGLHAEERRGQAMAQGGFRPIDMLLSKLGGGGG